MSSTLAPVETRDMVGFGAVVPTIEELFVADWWALYVSSFLSPGDVLSYHRACKPLHAHCRVRVRKSMRCNVDRLALGVFGIPEGGVDKLTNRCHGMLCGWFCAAAWSGWSVSEFMRSNPSMLLHIDVDVNVDAVFAVCNLLSDWSYINKAAFQKYPNMNLLSRKSLVFARGLRPQFDSERSRTRTFDPGLEEDGDLLLGADDAVVGNVNEAPLFPFHGDRHRPWSVVDEHTFCSHLYDARIEIIVTDCLGQRKERNRRYWAHVVPWRGLNGFDLTIEQIGYSRGSVHVSSSKTIFDLRCGVLRLGEGRTRLLDELKSRNWDSGLRMKDQIFNVVTSYHFCGYDLLGSSVFPSWTAICGSSTSSSRVSDTPPLEYLFQMFRDGRPDIDEVVSSDSESEEDPFEVARRI